MHLFPGPSACFLPVLEMSHPGVTMLCSWGRAELWMVTGNSASLAKLFPASKAAGPGALRAEGEGCCCCSSLCCPVSPLQLVCFCLGAPRVPREPPRGAQRSLPSGTGATAAPPPGAGAQILSSAPGASCTSWHEPSGLTWQLPAPCPVPCLCWAAAGSTGSISTPLSVPVSRSASYGCELRA